MASAAVLSPSRSPSPPFSADHSRRQSSAYSSSVGSFRTAPLGTQSPMSTSSSRSSLHTVGLESPTVNPIHTMGTHHTSHSEIHILKVTADSVQVETGPVPDSVLKKMSQTVSNVVTRGVDAVRNDEHIGPPPPSPPASVEREDTIEDDTKPDTTMLGGQDVFQEPEPLNSSGLSPESLRDRQISVSSSASTAQTATTRASTSIPSQRSSTDTRLSISTFRSQDTVIPSSAEPHDSSHYLQPPSVSIHRPTRRNTTGSAMQTLPSRLGMQQRSTFHQQYASQPHEDVSDVDDVASDIQIHAEKIRRERMEKRAKQQQAEAALTRTDTRRGEDTPLVGNLIGEDHVNYVLMYNMLTGIRIGVRRSAS